MQDFSSIISCEGGNPLTGLAYSVVSGIAESSNYPYIQRDGNCRANKVPPSYFLNNACVQQPNGDEDMLKLILVRYGAVAVGIMTTGTGLDFYADGVFFSDSCSSNPNKGDHAVVSNQFNI